MFYVDGIAFTEFIPMQLPIMCLLASILLTALQSVAHSAETQPIISIRCANRDLDLVTQLEIARDTRAPTTYLIVAHDMKMEARRLCYEGNEAKALKVYEKAIRILHDRPYYDRENGD